MVQNSSEDKDQRSTLLRSMSRQKSMTVERRKDQWC